MKLATNLIRVAQALVLLRFMIPVIDLLDPYRNIGATHIYYTRQFLYVVVICIVTEIILSVIKIIVKK